MKHILLLGSLLLIGCGRSPLILSEPVEKSPPPVIEKASSSSTFSSASSAQASTPQSIRLDLSFASQAPLMNWEDPYQEACEEASIILAHHYFSKAPLTNEIMDKEIVDLVQWETEHGYPQDVTAAQLGIIAREYYGYDTEYVENADVTADRMERAIAAGLPVIVPLDGQDVGNPYYSGDGPPYHVLVVVGFDPSHFITHDVGTRRGAYYEYDKDVLLDAIHDWTGSKETIRRGKKAMLIVRPTDS